MPLDGFHRPVLCCVRCGGAVYGLHCLRAAAYLLLNKEAAVPGKEVKNWKQYEALRREGKSKESAARITNASAPHNKGKGGKKK